MGKSHLLFIAELTAVVLPQAQVYRQDTVDSMSSRQPPRVSVAAEQTCVKHVHRMYMGVHNDLPSRLESV